MSTRRDVLIAAPALAAAAALPAGAAAAEPDPALEAVREWLTAYDAEQAAQIGDLPICEWDRPEFRAVREAEWQARTKACETVATTPAGIAAQLMLVVAFMGQVDPRADLMDPEVIETGEWNSKDDLDRKALISLLEGARALAQA